MKTMTELKNRVIRRENIPLGERVYSENTKPLIMLGAFFVIGIVLVFTDFMILGFILVIVSAYWIFISPDQHQIVIYDQYLVWNNQNHKELCTIIFFDEIGSWHIERQANGRRVLCLVMDDEEKIEIPLLEDQKVKKILLDMAPETYQEHEDQLD